MSGSTEQRLTPSGWMRSRGWEPRTFQEETWTAMDAGMEGLVNAPTGSGKTYSVLLPWLLKDRAGRIPSGPLVIWITPIRALAREIQLSADRVIASAGLPLTCGIRTGDTSASERAAQRTALPHILVTTPESLHLLLARKNQQTLFANLEVVVVDEWHELVGSKRGVQVELALSRLRTLAPSLKTWGISATIGNLPDALEMLLGVTRSRNGVLIRSGLKKQMEVRSFLPDEVERMPWAGHLGVRMADKLLPILHHPGSVLLFTNTRSQCEIWYRQLLALDPSLAGAMAMHHGSLSREIRQWVEDALYEGRLKIVVSTSSLDLGVDFAPVDTIIQVGGPKGVSRFIQRAGRSGHRPDAVSRIWFLPTHSLELIEAAALRQAIDDEFVEEKFPMTRCFDVLVQYMVTLSIGDGFSPDELFEEVKDTLCFADMDRAEWEWALYFVTRGGDSFQAYPEFQKVVCENGSCKVVSQRIARRHRLSIGTIVADTMMSVKLRRGGLVGHIEESFIASLNEGDHFWFAGQSLQLIQVKELTAWVRKSEAKGGRIPTWQGGKLPLSSRMSDMLRRKLGEAAGKGPWKDEELAVIQPIIDLQRKRSHVPATDELLIEQFESEEGHHLMFYPFEGRFVHEGLASLIAWRLGQLAPLSFSLAYNDYGFELLSDRPAPLDKALDAGLFDTANLESDVLRGVNATELASRKFREIASIAGLIFKGYPGEPVRDRHLQSSASLLFRVLEEYEPRSLLLRQAYDEVINYQLEFPRLCRSLERMKSQRVRVVRIHRISPFAFPIIVDRLRARMSTESLEDRVKSMVLDIGD